MRSSISRVLLRTQTRRFHASTKALDRAFIYKSHGSPTEVLQAITYPPPSAQPAAGTVNVKFLLGSVNPADINTIEGIYPSRPSLGSIGGMNDVYIAGNEGVAEVTAVGTGGGELGVGDWVIMDKPQKGTWSTNRNLKVEDVIKIDKVHGLTAPMAANMMVNFSTARNLLDSSLPQHPTIRDSVVMQNGANSGVGQAVIQMAAADGVHTINFVRDRQDFAALEKHLKDLGATYVFTYDDLADKTERKQIMQLAQELSEDGRGAHLALNCVGGDAATFMTQLLEGDHPLFVTYGAMSKQGFTFRASSQIFGDLRLHGFWQSRLSSRQTKEERQAVHRRILEYIEKGELREPEHEIVNIPATLSDEEAAGIFKDILGKLATGKYGRKVMLQME